MIDTSFIEETSNGDKGFIKEFFEMFLDLNPKSLESIREAINNKDFKELKHHAHQMKPSYDFIGLVESKNMCAEIELRCESQDIESIAKAFEVLERDSKIAYGELKKYLAELE